MIPHISTATSVSGRLTGVLVISNDEIHWKVIESLTDALKRSTGGNGK